MIKSWFQFGWNDDTVNSGFEYELQKGVINTQYQEYGSYIKTYELLMQGFLKGYLSSYFPKKIML